MDHNGCVSTLKSEKFKKIKGANSDAPVVLVGTKTDLRNGLPSAPIKSEADVSILSAISRNLA